MSLPGGFKEELKARVPLATLVGRHARLIRNGRNHKACCPFHGEKTPSFHVYEDGHYHCFGCGAHGDVISFQMAIANMSFPDAIESLAAEAGLEVPRPDPETREREARAASLEELVEAACALFEQRLRLPEGRAAMDYLIARGLSEETIARFRLGYAPPGGALRAALARDGHAEGALVDAGLVGRPDDGARPYDTFRDRVMFPIRDRRGTVVSFGGRVLGDGRPKYLNGPETALFSKSRLLYGLHEAGPAIRERAEVIVAEGYMDVIALAAAGFPQAVAPLGTALTEEQIRMLWRLTPEPVLCFDGDTAGQRAAGRALDRVLPMVAAGYSLRFALLPTGQDPDDLIRARGPGAMRAVLDGAVPMVEMCWRRLRANHRMDTPERRAGLERDIERTAQAIEDRAVAQQYRAALRDRFWSEIKAGRPAGSRGARSPRPGAPGARPPPPPGTANPVGALPARRLQESILIATLLNHPDLLDKVAERLGLLVFDDPELSGMRSSLLKIYHEWATTGPALDTATLVNHLKASGHEGTVARVLGPGAHLYPTFSQPSAQPADALRGWHELFELYGRASIEEDLREARARYEADLVAGQTGEKALARLMALQAARADILDSSGAGES